MNQATASYDSFLTSAEVCAILQICSKTLRRICNRKEINFVRISRTTFRFRRASVDLYIASHEVKAR